MSGAGEGMNNSKQEQKWAKLLLPLAVAALGTLAILACRGDGDTPEGVVTINPDRRPPCLPRHRERLQIRPPLPWLRETKSSTARFGRAQSTR